MKLNKKEKIISMGLIVLLIAGIVTQLISNTPTPYIIHKGEEAIPNTNISPEQVALSESLQKQFNTRTYDNHTIKEKVEVCNQYITYHNITSEIHSKTCYTTESHTPVTHYWISVNFNGTWYDIECSNLQFIEQDKYYPDITIWYEGDDYTPWLG